MIKTIMMKLGYYKLSTNEKMALTEIVQAYMEAEDLFIDYVKKTGNQKFYKKVGKKKILVNEIKWE